MRARMLCNTAQATPSLFLAVTGPVTVHCTAAAPVVFTRRPLSTTGGGNNYCLVSFGPSTIDYARFSATPLEVGAPSQVRDSLFDPVGNGGDRS